ncbi:MAG: EAL domain-containing protein [Steroidobacteraceae bacterium]
MEPQSIPLAVVTARQEQVEWINKTLRNAGHPVHLGWVGPEHDPADALRGIRPEMILLFEEPGTLDLASLLEVRGKLRLRVPVLVVLNQVSEAAIARCIQGGARDAVSQGDPGRFVMVFERELQGFRLERSLAATVAAAREYARQLNDLVQGSADAIAVVQEGIVVDANRAWVELLEQASIDSVVGLPLMDTFDADSHPALKGAIAACLQNSWGGNLLRASTSKRRGKSRAVELSLIRVDSGGEPAVRLTIASGRDQHALQEQLEEALRKDPSTGLLHRRYFLEALRSTLAANPVGGVRQLAYIEPDRYEDILSQLGILTGEDFLVEFAQRLRELLQPGDLAGRLTGAGFMVLLQRGNGGEAEAWSEHVVKRMGEHVFRAGSSSFSATCTVGLGIIPPTLTDPSGPATDAFQANRRGRELGGNRVHAPEKTDTLLRLQSSDKTWVLRLRAALAENRFRLVQQPIASLVGGDNLSLFDVALRMRDEQNEEVLPSEFMKVAERNGLSADIDRWVVTASLGLCASRRSGALFVRISRDSIVDPTFADFLAAQVKAIPIDPSRIVLQFREEAAAQQLRELTALRQVLAAMKFRTALENFGRSPSTQALTERLKPDFVKLDGTLMQGLSQSTEKQERARKLVELARTVQAVTVAERVEDANTMAVLWQLGVGYIQGYFVNMPEQVVLGEGDGYEAGSAED